MFPGSLLQNTSGINQLICYIGSPLAKTINETLLVSVWGSQGLPSKGCSNPSKEIRPFGGCREKVGNLWNDLLRMSLSRKGSLPFFFKENFFSLKWKDDQAQTIIHCSLIFVPIDSRSRLCAFFIQFGNLSSRWLLINYLLPWELERSI